MTEKIQTLLAGRWRDASGPAYETEYPHDGSAVAQLNAATVGDVDEAVQTAEQARTQPAWARLMPHERAGMLHRSAQGIHIASIGGNERAAQQVKPLDQVLQYLLPRLGPEDLHHLLAESFMVFAPVVLGQLRDRLFIADATHRA